MALTNDDKRWIANEIAASEDRSYRRIKDGALSELRGEIRTEMGELRTELGEMIGEVGRQVDHLEGEMRVMNENVSSIREHLGI